MKAFENRDGYPRGVEMDQGPTTRRQSPLCVRSSPKPKEGKVPSKGLTNNCGDDFTGLGGRPPIQALVGVGFIVSGVGDRSLGDQPRGQTPSWAVCSSDRTLA
jgi:hypothetical protein